MASSNFLSLMAAAARVQAQDRLNMLGQRSTSSSVPVMLENALRVDATQLQLHPVSGPATERQHVQLAKDFGAEEIEEPREKAPEIGSRKLDLE